MRQWGRLMVAESQLPLQAFPALSIYDSARLGSLVAQLVKNPPAVRETWVRSLSWEDCLQKGKDTDSSILAWRIPWTD